MTNIPVTNDMIKDENKWVTELAGELAGVLKGMMKDRGIVALDEVWGGWNRARGIGTCHPFYLSNTHLTHYDNLKLSFHHQHSFKSSHTSHTIPPHPYINAPSKILVSPSSTHHPILLKPFQIVSSCNIYKVLLKR